MPSISLSTQTNLSPDDCFQRVSQMFENDKELKKFDPGFQCQFDPGARKGTAEGKQFKARMSVKAQGAGSLIEIELDLPFHLALAKGLVKSTLEKKLSHVLG